MGYEFTDHTLNTQQIEQLTQASLDPPLLKKGHGSEHPLSGHCYVAAEALYHALGGHESQWFPVRARDVQGACHWWLENFQGDILDPTSAQYTSRGVMPPYEHGRRDGFLTIYPSKRAQVVLDRMAANL